MDYRARGSWIGNVRWQQGEAGYGGSDVTCILAFISSVMRVRGPTAIYHEYDGHSMHTFIDRGIITYCIHLFYSDSSLFSLHPRGVVLIIHQWP